MTRKPWWRDTWALEELDGENYLPLYHGTSSKNAARIDASGLCVPEITGRRVWVLKDLYDEVRLRGIYVTPDFKSALEWAEVAAVNDGGEPVVYQIDEWDAGCTLVDDPEADPYYDDARYLIVGCKCVKARRTHG